MGIIEFSSRKIVRRTAATVAAVGAALVLALLFGAAAHAAAQHQNPHPNATYGNPAAAAPYWRQQSLDDCALMAAADVIGELTGRQPSEQEIIAVAQRLGSRAHAGPIYSTGYGTDPGDIPALLGQYGIYGVATSQDDAAATGLDSGMEALERYLAGGHKVIAGVNAELIWGLPVQTKDNRGNPMSDHAVVVTGIDLAAAKVHLNDSANPNGADETVSIELFTQAWATGHNQLVVTRESG
jgi:hypothetical protein